MYRVISVIGLGIILLVTSYLYQRSRGTALGPRAMSDDGGPPLDIDDPVGRRYTSIYACGGRLFQLLINTGFIREVSNHLVLLTLGVAAVAAVLVLQVLRTGGLPNPLAHGDFGARVLDIAVLVFREGLECILVLAAVTANMGGAKRSYQRPVAAGAAGALAATLLTWFSPSAHRKPRRQRLRPEPAGGDRLLAIVVLLVVMNWFFHKVYWTGWISMHSRESSS